MGRNVVAAPDEWGRPRRQRRGPVCLTSASGGTTWRWALIFRRRSWGTDGTWYGWLFVLGVAAAILWVSIGVLRGDDDWAPRGSPALAWTGERLFVYGGNPVPSERESALNAEPLNDAALIDPANGDVDQLPDPPFDRPLRVGPAAVAVDDEVVVVGQLCRETEHDDRACDAGAYRGAVYSVADDDWREIDLPNHLKLISNGQSEALGTTSDGRAVLVLGARDGFGAVANREIWTYSPADDEWEQLPSPGSLIEGVCLAGDDVVVGSGLLPQTAAGPPVTPTDPAAVGPSLAVLALDGDARVWFPTGQAGVMPTGDQASITCGDEVVLFDDGSEALRVFDFGPEGGWRNPAAKPGDDVHASRLWTGEEFLFLDANAPTLGYDPVADTWRGIENSAPTGLRSVWTGDSVVGWPGRTDTPVQFDVDGDS
jgi:hypothetical protein